MSVDRVDQVFDGAFQGDCGHSFGNDFRNGSSNHVNAEDLTVVGIGDDFHETIAGVFNLRLAYSRKWKLACSKLISSFSSLGFGQADTCHLRITISTGRHVVVVDWNRVLIGDSFDSNDALLLSHVGQQRRRRHIADGVYALDVRLHKLIHLDKAAIRRDANLLESDVCRIWAAARRHQQFLNREVLDFAFFGLKCDLNACVLWFGTLEFRLRIHLDALFREDALEFLRNFLILQRNDAGSDFNYRHLL